MARPDQDPLLRAMGSGEQTCEMCVTHLFPDLPDSVCDDCDLNPLKNGAMTLAEFVNASIETASEEPLSDIKKE